jgi:hemerythrin-like domain-containing protein
VDETKDGITVLREDHRRVVELFQRIEDIPSDAPADSVEMKQRRALFEQVSEELSRHAVAEEQLLYPLVRNAIPHGAELADHALDEHQQVKETLDKLEKMGRGDLAFEGELRTLMAAIREHVDEEESELLPLLEAHVDADTIQALGMQLQAAKVLAPTHPHPNAPNTPPLNVVVAAGAALVDRARDALTGRGDPDRM